MIDTDSIVVRIPVGCFVYAPDRSTTKSSGAVASDLLSAPESFECDVYTASPVRMTYRLMPCHEVRGVDMRPWFRVWIDSLRSRISRFALRFVLSEDLR